MLNAYTHAHAKLRFFVYFSFRSAVCNSLLTLTHNTIAICRPKKIFSFIAGGSGWPQSFIVKECKLYFRRNNKFHIKRENELKQWQRQRFLREKKIHAIRLDPKLVRDDASHYFTFVLFLDAKLRNQNKMRWPWTHCWWLHDAYIFINSSLLINLRAKYFDSSACEQQKRIECVDKPINIITAIIGSFCRRIKSIMPNESKSDVHASAASALQNG